jgi:maltose/maltodextrin transport system permease protein
VDPGKTNPRKACDVWRKKLARLQQSFVLKDSRPALSIRHLLIALVALPALYLDFVIYETGSTWIALGLLVVVGLGIYIYLSNRAYTYRYLFPGFVGFALFVIFPLVYTVFVSLTRYSSSNLLPYERALKIFGQETFLLGNASYNYKLLLQQDGRYVLYLEDDKDSLRRFVSEPFDLKAAKESARGEEPSKLKRLADGSTAPGKPLELAQVTREKLYMPMRGRPFLLPDNTLVGLEGLQKFVSRGHLWKVNPDGSLTNVKDGSTVRPNFKEGRFVNEKGQTVGVGFRTFTGLENYIQILTDPRIQGPFFRIFLWTVLFSGLSVLGTFALGMLLAVMLEWKELRFRQAYRTLLILPYAVPSVLSILIFKGLYNQEFGAVNELLRALHLFTPEWETNPWGARAMILLVNLWLGYPYMMLVSTGMLQSVPSTIYEASAIEGSNPVIDFFKLTLPLVFPPLLPILIASFAFNFNNFTLVYLLTAGGPKMVGGGIAGETDLLVTYTFNLAFRDSGTNYGLASAIATLLFFVVGTLSWVNLRLNAKKVRV